MRDNREARPAGAFSGNGHGEWASDSEPRDQVRWGSIWAGALVALSTFIVLEMLLYAVGVLDIGWDAGAGTSIVNGLLGLLAFFLGGLAAAASMRPAGSGSGLRQGLLAWALTVAGIVLFTLLGGGVLLGSVGNVVTQLNAAVAQQGALGAAGGALTDVKNTAGWAVLFLGAWAIAAATGGLLGGAAGSKRQNTHEH